MTEKHRQVLGMIDSNGISMKDLKRKSKLHYLAVVDVVTDLINQGFMINVVSVGSMDLLEDSKMTKLYLIQE